MYQENDSSNCNKIKTAGPTIIVVEIVKAAGNEMITQMTLSIESVFKEKYQKIRTNH